MSWKPGQPIAVETKRFKVRTLQPEDATADYLSWWNDPGIQRGFNMPARNWTLGRARQHIASFDNVKTCHCGIYTKSDLELIGFFTILQTPKAGFASINICIGNPKHRGGQTALEVAQAMIDFMFGEMGIRKVEGRVLGQNHSSIAVYLGLKFKPEGVLRKHMNGIGGGRIDIYVFGMLKDEWVKKSQQDKTAP